MSGTKVSFSLNIPHHSLFVEKVTVLEMRSHIAWYLKGIPGSVEVKNQVFKATTIKELETILTTFKEQL